MKNKVGKYKAILIGLFIGYCFLLYQFSKADKNYNACLSNNQNLKDEFNLGGEQNEYIDENKSQQ